MVCHAALRMKAPWWQVSKNKSTRRPRCVAAGPPVVSGVAYLLTSNDREITWRGAIMMFGNAESSVLMVDDGQLTVCAE